MNERERLRKMKEKERLRKMKERERLGKMEERERGRWGRGRETREMGDEEKRGGDD